MKKLTKLVIMAALALVTFTGCTQAESEKIALAVVGTGTANSPEIPLNSNTIKNAIYNSCYTHGSVSFITTEGEPNLFYSTKIPEPSTKGLTKNKKETIANDYTDQLLSVIKSNEITHEEVNTLKAITIASKALSVDSEDAEKVMIIMDSGLSTTGYLDFTKDILYAETEDIINALTEKEAIPDLTGIKVVWMFNGQTCYPQPELSEAQKHHLREIWSEILKAGNAKEYRFVEDIATSANTKNMPYVSVVNVEEAETDIEIKPIETKILDNTSLEFIGDKAEFVDEEAAVSAISEVAEELYNNPDNCVYIVGTTATGGEEFCNQLSVDRAAAVKNELVKLGIDESRMEVIGLGFSDPWHIPDLGDNGLQIEEFAKQNRKVLIIDKNSDDAGLIK